MHQSEYERAKALLIERLALCRHLGGKKPIALALGGVASAAAAQSDYVRAARLFGAAEAVLKTVSMPLAPADAVEYNRHMDIARGNMPEIAWNAAFEDGVTMLREQAITYALLDLTSI